MDNGQTSGSGKEALERECQRLKELYDIKSEFVSLMVHQLRTPLSALKWSLKMMLDGEMGELTAEQRNMLAKSYESNNRMIQLVNDILNVERIEAGELQYAFEKVDLAAILRELVAEIASTADEGKVGVHVDVSEEPLPAVRGDREKLKVVFQNLLDNAVKYSKEGGSVTITARAEDHSVLVSVTDTGIGISEKEQNRIFSRFFRGTNALEVKSSGSGLGLYITKVIVEGHGGTISFTSKKGEGTTFTVALPRYRGEG